jgi:hypothetical protein
MTAFRIRRIPSVPDCRVLLLLPLLAWPLGCQAPAATLELLAVAQAGLDDADAAARNAQQQRVAQYQQTLNSLDAAFDADVKLVAVGGATDPDGRPIALTPEWVIEARQGYAAARSLLAEQALQQAAVHETHLDNLQAARDALELARTLIVTSWSVRTSLKEQFLSLQRSLSHD